MQKVGQNTDIEGVGGITARSPGTQMFQAADDKFDAEDSHMFNESMNYEGEGDQPYFNPEGMSEISNNEYGRDRTPLKELELQSNAASLPPTSKNKGDALGSLSLTLDK